MSFGTITLGFGTAARPSTSRSAAQTPAPSASGRRYQMLDVWRGAICLLVVLEHVGVVIWPESDRATGLEAWARWAIFSALTLNVGTALFFVISGYCIAACVDSARRKGQGPLDFLAKRLWRIFPTYWAALLVFVVFVLGVEALGLPRYRESDLSLALGLPQDLTWAQWLGNLTLSETWRPFVGGGHSNVFTRVAWSLCYQEQFYAVCCLALWLTPNRAFRTLGWATVALLLFRGIASDIGVLHRFEGTFPVYWHLFAVGLGVHWRLNAGADAPAWAHRCLDGLLVALAGLALAGGNRESLAAAVFGLALIRLHPWDEAAGRAAWLNPLRACGRRSFSIYLIHLPVVAVANVLLFDHGMSGWWTRVLVIMPVSATLAVATGFLFHHAVERHFLGAPSLAALGIRRRPAAAIPAPKAMGRPVPVPVTVSAVSRAA